MAQPSIAYVIDKDYTVLSFNHSAAEAYPQLKVGEKCHKCLSDLDSPCPPCPAANGIVGPRTYFDPIRKIGETVDAVEMVLPDGTEGYALVCSSSDEEIAHVNENDQLTGLLNRVGLMHFCAHFTPSTSDAFIGTMATYVSNFDSIMYHYGRDVVSAAIRYVAQALQAPDGSTTVAYAGAGLFLGVMVADEALDLGQLPGAMERIAAAAPGAEIHLKTGVFTGTIADGPLTSLIEYAESALNSIRAEEGQDFKAVTFESYRVLAAEREHLATILEAIDAGEFDIYLQPKCQIATGALVGSEALARWIKPDGTVVAPGEFVPLLEKSGFISHLDVVVWEKTFQALRAWLDAGLEPLPVSVNVSRIDIMDVDVADTFIQMASAYEVPARLVEIEITESAYVEDEGSIRLTEQRLQDVGFRVLIDDFGSGYSSLTLLKDIDADILKLDMGFLHYDTQDAWRAMDIVHSVLDMAHKLDMYVIVEGVETKEQTAMLDLLGCEFAQGYYFYKPMSRTDFEQLLSGETAKIAPKADRGSHRSNVQRLAECFWRLAEVNVVTGVYRFIRNVPEPPAIANPRPATMEEYTERYIEHGYIHPDDVEAYREATNLAKLHADIQRGAHREHRPFRFREFDQWRWYELEAVLPDDYSEDEPWVLFTWKEAADDISQREDVRALMSAMYMQVYRFDLRTLQCDVIKSKMITGPKIQMGHAGSPAFIEAAVDSGAVHPDDAAGLLSFSNIEGLRKFFKYDGHKRSVVFRMGRDGEWMRCIAEVSESVDYSPEHPTILCTMRAAQVSVSEAEVLQSTENANSRVLFEQAREAKIYEFIFNYTKNTVVQGADLQAFAGEMGLTADKLSGEALAEAARRMMPEEHVQRYLEFVGAERMRQLYSSGVHYDHVEYQRICDGELRWRRIDVHLYSPVGTDEIWGNCVVSDI